MLDYAGARLDRKLTTGGCLFLRCRLISWQCKKQTVVTTSFTKAEYKSEGSEGFHQIVDFLTTSHIRHALTESPTIYVSLIEQFWQTATASTLKNGDMEIIATIDGKVKVISEASIRRHLKLEDSDGIRNLPTTEIFEQLALIGNMKRASKGYTGVDTSLFQTMLVQGQILQDEGSTILVKQETKVSQPSSPTQTHVADEAASTGVDTKKVYGDAYTKLIKKVKRLEDKLNKSRRKRRLDLLEEEDSDTEILAQEDPSKQRMKIAQIDDDEGITQFTTAEDVSTANVPVSTAGVEINTFSPKVKTVGVSVYDVAIEAERQRIASIHEEARTFKPEEWDNIQAQIEADEELAHRLQAQERERFSEADKAKLLLRGYSFDEIKVLFEAIVERVNTFTPMKSDDIVPKVVTGSSKRSTEEELGEESSKRQKMGEGSEPVEESKDKESDELSQEQIQHLMIIVPEEGMNVEALQTKCPIIDWEVYTENSRMYLKIIRVGNHTEVYQIFVDMLKNFDRDDLVRLWSLVHKRFNSTEPTKDKERELWVELKRLFEPVDDDELWKS
ncbi:hypothetical protein Tco_1276901 [Tanacetum coccineum]